VGLRAARTERVGPPAAALTLRGPGVLRARPARGGDLGAYAYLAPAGLLLLAFQVYPLFYGGYVSLFRWGLTRQAFLGLANYAGVLRDPDFWRSLLVTGYYVAGVVPAEIVLGFLIAVLLSQRIRGRAVYRLVYFLPYVTSMVALGLVWSWIFNANFGLANAVLRLLHLPPQRWLLEPRGLLGLLRGGAGFSAWAGGPSLALACVMVVTVWYYTGFHVVVYLAGLGAIPREIYEAARLDGARGWRLLRHITLPLVSATTFFLAVVATIGAFQSFSIVYTLTGGGASGGLTSGAGGPLGTTRVVTLFIFNTFYSEFRVGYATAAAFVLFAILLGLTLAQLRLGSRRVHYLGH
jgi:ABC-type sugar transport system permease subunit